MTWYNSLGQTAPTAVRVERKGKMVWLMNPAASAEWREANGYTLTERPPAPTMPVTEDWQPLSVFIIALRQIITTEVAETIMSNPTMMLDVLAGALQLASEKTQGGYIDMMHPDVPTYLSVLGVSVGQVKQVMDTYTATNGGVQ